MLTELLLVLVFISLAAALYLLYGRYIAVLKMVHEFKPVQTLIGKVPMFTQNQEDALCSNKEFLEAVITYLGHQHALANAKIHNRSISNDDIRFYMGQCDAYDSSRNSMTVLLERKKKNDK